MRTTLLAVLLAGCGGAVCPAGQASTGLFGACCLPGQTATWGTCEGPPTACPAGWDLAEAACVRRDLPPFRLVRVPTGSFTMGCTEERDGENHVCKDNAPFEATLTRPFAVMATEVTQELYEALTGDNPSRLKGCATCPVERVSWNDAVRFANALSAWEGRVAAYRIDGDRVTWDRAADGYRLPTEAEWEYAARAGEDWPFAGSDDLDAVAWHEGNGTGGTNPVGTRQPNAWGLHDMSGNVFEWTWSPPHDYPTTPTVDPTGPEHGEARVVRGGAWSGIPDAVWLSARGWIPPDFQDVILGFRLVRSVAPDEPALLEPAGPWSPPSPR